MRIYKCRYLTFDKNKFLFRGVKANASIKFNLYPAEVSPIFNESNIAQEIKKLKDKIFYIGTYHIGDGYYVERKTLENGTVGYGLYDTRDNKFTGHEYALEDLIPQNLGSKKILRARVVLLRVVDETSG